jgi:predicted lipoprotein with Yx(FWY)xxD motif
MRHRMLAASAVFGTLLLAVVGCRGSAAPGAAYNGTTANTTTNAPQSMASSAAASPSSGSSAGTRSAVLTVRKTRLGYVLANASGYTIYWFAKDHKGSARSACTGGCLTAWPPVTGTPVAAKGVRLNGVLGTITRSDGLVQATYNGYPLYLFASDSAPGQTTGNDAAGVWHVIKEKKPAKSKAARSTGSSSSSTGGSSTSGGTSTSGGYGY